MGNPEFGRWWARLLRQGASPGGAIALMNLIGEIDVRASLPAIRVPTLVLHRRDDRFIRRRARPLPGRPDPRRPLRRAGRGRPPAVVGDPEALLDEIEEFLTGAAPGREPDRGWRRSSSPTSSARPSSRPSSATVRWRDLLERHDATVRNELEPTGAARSRRWATASSPPSTDRRGRSAARGRSARRAEPLGLEIRAGLHSGEVEIIGDDVGGMAVNIGARVEGPGRARRGAGVQHREGAGRRLGHRVRGPGRAHLKGAPGEWRLFAVS